MVSRWVLPFRFLVLCSLLVVWGIAAGADPADAASPHLIDLDLSADENGLYLTRSDGTVETRGPAPHFGDRPPLAVGESVNALAVTPDGGGYWLFTNRGNVFEFGSAPFYGDVGHLVLNGEIIDAAPTSDGTGYFMIGSDGGIFAFGSAEFRGSIPQVLGSTPLNAPVVGISVTPGGYVLIAADGGTFTFGAAEFYGSIPGVLGSTPLASPIVGLVPGSAGYLMLGGDGGIFNFGRSAFFGSLAGVAPADVVAVAAREDLSGYMILDADGTIWPFGDTRRIGITRFEGTGWAEFPADLANNPIVYALVSADDSFNITATSGTSHDERIVSGAANYEGFGLVTLADPTAIRVRGSANWVIELLPESYARQWRTTGGTVDGTGNDVLRVTRPPTGSLALVTVDAPSESATTFASAYQVGGDLVDEFTIGLAGSKTEDQYPLPTWSGDSLLELETTGSWSLRAETRVTHRATFSTPCFYSGMLGDRVTSKYVTNFETADIPGIAAGVGMTNRVNITRGPGWGTVIFNLDSSGFTHFQAGRLSACPDPGGLVATASGLLSNGEMYLVELRTELANLVDATCSTPVNGWAVYSGSFRPWEVPSLPPSARFADAEFQPHPFNKNPELTVTSTRITFRYTTEGAPCAIPGIAVAGLDGTTTSGVPFTVYLRSLGR